MRFSICHEVAHTFFPGWEKREHTRSRRGLPPFDPSAQVERLCDTIAAELLMPTEHFLDSVRKTGFSVTGVEALSETYGASKEAVAIRMVESGLKSCAMAVLVYRTKKPRSSKRSFLPNGVSPSSLKNMRVVYSAKSPQFPWSLPRFYSAGSESCIHHAAWMNESETATEDVGFQDGIHTA